jgi:hypothetical protein
VLLEAEEVEGINLITLEVQVDNQEDRVVEEELDHPILQEIQVLEMEHLDKEIQEELEQHVTALMITEQAEAEVEQVKLEDSKEDLYQKLHKAE